MIGKILKDISSTVLIVSALFCKFVKHHYTANINHKSLMILEKGFFL